MIPHDDDHDALLKSPDTEFRRLTIVQAVSELAMARAQEIDEDQIRVYTLSLLDLDLDLMVEACRYLGRQKRREGETALPSVGDIRDRCWYIRAQEQRAKDEREAASRLGLKEPLVDPAKWGEFKSRVQEAIRRHSMSK